MYRHDSYGFKERKKMRPLKYRTVEVDALTGKAHKIGRLRDAKGFVKEKPYRRSRRQWRTLLGGRGRPIRKKKSATADHLPTSSSLNSRKKKKDRNASAPDFHLSQKKKDSKVLEKVDEEKYECTMCCEAFGYEDVIFFHCKKRRAGKTVTDKAVCITCLIYLEGSPCPFCRSHAFSIPRMTAVGRRPKKRSAASIALQRRRIQSKRRIAESHGYRVVGYTTMDQHVTLPSGFVLRFSTSMGETPIFLHRSRCYQNLFEPPLIDGDAVSMEYDDVDSPLEEEMVEAMDAVHGSDDFLSMWSYYYR